MTARTRLIPPQGRTSGRRRHRLAAVGAAALVVLLAACSGSATNESSTGGFAASDSESAESAPEAVEGDAAAPEGEGGTTADRATAGDVDASALEPRRIRRGQVTVEVEDLTLAASRVRDLAAGLEGYVSDESVSTAIEDLASGSSDGSAYPASQSSRPVTSDEPLPESVPGEGRLVLRVPPAQMEAAMDGIADVGQELNRWSGETDVERTLVDLESRIATQERSVADIRALMERATTLEDIVMLEAEVNERTADLESLKAQQESVAEEAALATVTAVLRTPSAQAVAEEERTGFLGGLLSGVDALQSSVSVLLTVVGALLPFAVVAALVGYPVSRVLRRRRANRPAPQPAWAGGYPPVGPSVQPAGPAPSGPAPSGPAPSGPAPSGPAPKPSS